MVMFIHRPNVSATEAQIKSGKIIKDAADLIIAKHRNGELGRVKLRFRGDQVRYVNPPPGFLPDEPGEVGRDDVPETNDSEGFVDPDDVPFDYMAEYAVADAGSENGTDDDMPPFDDFPPDEE